MGILIKNGLVIEPRERIKERLDIYIEDGVIKKVSPRIDDPHARIIDADGSWVISSVTDCHVHLRDPGFEYKETIESGLLAAVKGGITRVLCMANTNPVNDNPSVLGYVLRKARNANLAKLYPICSVTKGMKGKELSPFLLLREEGAVAFSDDGYFVSDALVMRRALEYIKTFKGIIISHCEIPELTRGGVVNEGSFSTRTGLPAIPPEAEVIAVYRDVTLAEYTGSRIHIAHVSLEKSLDIISSAKNRGVDVSCETCPHYFLLSDDGIDPTDADFKVNPPIRSRDDMEGIRRAVADGRIDIVSSDHAPHSYEDKFTDFISAPFGISGIETLLPLTLILYHKGLIDEFRFVELIALNPSERFGIGYGGFREGSPADITILDPEKEWIIDPNGFVSKGKNTPFKGWKVKGKVLYTLVDGDIKYPFEEKMP